MYKKHKAGLCIKQFVTFIKKQNRKSVKHIQLNQEQEFGIQDLESWLKKKQLKWSSL